MSVSTLTVLMLLTGSPATGGETPPPATMIQAAPLQDPTTPTLATQGSSALEGTPSPPAALQSPLPTEAPPLALPSLPTDARPAPAPAQSADDDAIIVRARPHAPPGDPLQAVNMKTYEVVQVADKVIVAPAANTYSRVLPSFFRAGVRHFFGNLNEPIVFLNYLLQHKVGKAFETAGRFGINSTIGVGGLLEVAQKRPFNLPKRRNGFANTMGFYGVKPGPFLFVPLVGPTTVRDLLGLWVDRLVLPVTIGKPFNRVWYGVPSTIIQTLDYRVEFDAQLRKFREAPSPYAASRAAYLQSRVDEIAALHVHKPRKVKARPEPAAATEKDGRVPVPIP